MKKLLALAIAVVAVPFSAQAQDDSILSYDYFEATWAYSSYDIGDFDDSNGARLDLSVSLSDDAYISLFGTIQDESSNVGLAIGIHTELAEPVDVYAEIGAYYDDLYEDFGPVAGIGLKWEVCKHLELDAGIGVNYIDDEANFLGNVDAIIPIYKGLSIVAGALLQDDGQTYRAGLRLNF